MTLSFHPLFLFVVFCQCQPFAIAVFGNMILKHIRSHYSHKFSKTPIRTNLLASRPEILPAEPAFLAAPLRDLLTESTLMENLGNQCSFCRFAEGSRL